VSAERIELTPVTGVFPPNLSPDGYVSRVVSALILAGGKNTRMGGEDKAFLTVEGASVFERTFALLRRCFPQVVVVSNCPDKYRRFDVDVVADEIPDLGPLGGLHAGLGRLRQPYAFVVACDMPFLRIEPIAFLVARLHGQDAVIPRWEDDIEPLHALYATHLRAPIARAVERGARAIRDFLPQIDVEFVPEVEMRAVPGAAESFRNINTPAEAARFSVRRSLGANG